MKNLTFIEYLVIFLLLALVVSVTTCNCNRQKLKDAKGQKEVVIRTETKRDTVLVHDSFNSVSYVPKPYSEVRYQTLTISNGKLPQLEVLRVDTAAILSDFYASRFYSDTLPTKYGKLTLSDTITQNRIAGRSWSADFAIPTITNTITNTVKVKGKPKRFGIGLQVGYGLSIPDYKHPFQNTKLAPTISVGLSYNFIRF